MVIGLCTLLNKIIIETFKRGGFSVTALCVEKVYFLCKFSVHIFFNKRIVFNSA